MSDPTDAQIANTVAEIRQGESSTPRCEPPSEYDVEIALGWVRRVRKAEALIAAAKAAPKTPYEKAPYVLQHMIATEPTQDDYFESLTGEVDLSNATLDGVKFKSCKIFGYDKASAKNCTFEWCWFMDQHVLNGPPAEAAPEPSHKHSPQLAETLRKAAANLSNRPEELRGPFKIEPAPPAVTEAAPDEPQLMTGRMARAGRDMLISLGYENVEFTDAQKVYEAMTKAARIAR